MRRTPGALASWEPPNVLGFFCDDSRVRHSAEVTAESFYEPAVLGIKAVSEHLGGGAGHRNTPGD
jgi:hypothetical protein